MISLLLMIAIGCDFSTPPPTIERKAKAPKQERATNKRPKSASASEDTAGGSSDIIQDAVYKPEEPSAFDDIEIVVQTTKSKSYVDVDITWYVNDRKLISQRDTVLRHRNFSKGDKVQAEIEARRGDQTDTFSAPTIVVGNSPPRILTNPNSLTQLDGFRVRAEDPDGGRVTYHVQGGPKGLSIGENTGVVRYKPSKDADGGQFDITIVVRDEDGSESEWRFTVSVSGGSESASAIAERERRKAEAKAKFEADVAAREEARRQAEASDEN